LGFGLSLAAMDIDLLPALEFALFLLVPALIVFTIFVVMRLRRGKFKRQRIARRSHRVKTEDQGTGGQTGNSSRSDTRRKS